MQLVIQQVTTPKTRDQRLRLKMRIQALYDGCLSFGEWSQLSDWITDSEWSQLSGGTTDSRWEN
jgi:predicted HTH domain antitoxin